MPRRSFAVAAVLCLCGTAALCGTDSTPAESRAPRPIPAIVFIPTPHDVVDEMLRLAEVRRSDTLYDLGCGDGRVVVAAARRYGCRAVGLDIDPRRVQDATKNVQRNRLTHLVKIRTQDLFKADLGKATIVTLYLSSSANAKLIPQLNRMKPGSRVISHQFGIRGIEPDRTVQFRSKDDGRIHTLYRWITPLKQEPPRPCVSARESSSVSRRGAEAQRGTRNRRSPVVYRAFQNSWILLGARERAQRGPGFADSGPPLRYGPGTPIMALRRRLIIQ